MSRTFSPSSIKDDLGAKAADYLQLPSLAAYLVLSQEEPKAWIWRRNAAGFAKEPMVVSGRDARIEIPAHGIDVPLSEIYAGLF